MGTGIRSDPSTGNSPLISLGSTLHLVSTPTELCLHLSRLHLHPNALFAFATPVTALDSPRTSSPTHQTPSYISPPPTVTLFLAFPCRACLQPGPHPRSVCTIGPWICVSMRTPRMHFCRCVQHEEPTFTKRRGEHEEQQGAKKR
jgi:hypothetical protein